MHIFAYIHICMLANMCADVYEHKLHHYHHSRLSSRLRVLVIVAGNNAVESKYPCYEDELRCFSSEEK